MVQAATTYDMKLRRLRYVLSDSDIPITMYKLQYTHIHKHIHAHALMHTHTYTRKHGELVTVSAYERSS